MAAAIGGLAALGVAAPAAAAPAREYELVSPVDKRFVDVRSVPSATDDGSSLLYTLWGSTRDDDPSFGAWTSLVGQRGATAWAEMNANVGFLGGPSVSSHGDVVDVSADRTSAIIRSGGNATADDQDGGRSDLFLLNMRSGATTFLSRGPGTGPDTLDYDVMLYGATRDHRRIVFAAEGPLVPGAPPPSGGEASLYEWEDGKLSLLSRLDDGTPVTVAARGTSARGPGVGGAASVPTAPHRGVHLVSDDGSVVVFRSRQGVPGVYARINGTQTRDVSRSQRTTGGAGSVPAGTMGSGDLIGASRDGSVVFFSSTDLLSDDASPGGGIYRYDMGNDDLEMVTDPYVSVSPFSPTGVLSDDASRVTFSVEGTIGGEGDPNATNVFTWDATNGTRFVASLPTSVNEGVRRISRDGRFSLIVTTATLGTGTNNGQPAIYRYDAQTDDLECASCRGDGSPSQAGARLHGTDDEESVRNITDDGTVFFMTTDRLDAVADTDDKMDVYGYDGRPFLVSTGTTEEAFVGDNSDDGSTVFLRTREALVPEDTDGGLMDAYAARTGGVFPPPKPPTPPVCVGIECAPPPVLPVVPGPGSVGVGPVENAIPTAPPEETAVKPSVRLSRLSAAAVRNLARGKRVKVRVRIAGGGELTVRLRARVGKKTVTVGSTTRTIRREKALTANVSVRLTASGRRRLRAAKRMRTTIEARVEGASPARSSLTLKAAR